MTTQVFQLEFKDGKRCTCIAMARLSEKEHKDNLRRRFGDKLKRVEGVKYGQR